jgi:hypothetical protein
MRKGIEESFKSVSYLISDSSKTKVKTYLYKYDQFEEKIWKYEYLVNVGWMEGNLSLKIPDGWS